LRFEIASLFVRLACLVAAQMTLIFLRGFS
jgi:hypothetical protein